jgi:hypothetical protein
MCSDVFGQTNDAGGWQIAGPVGTPRSSASHREDVISVEVIYQSRAGICEKGSAASGEQLEGLFAVYRTAQHSHACLTQ